MAYLPYRTPVRPRASGVPRLATAAWLAAVAAVVLPFLHSAVLEDWIDWWFDAGWGMRALGLRIALATNLCLAVAAIVMGAFAARRCAPAAGQGRAVTAILLGGMVVLLFVRAALR